MSGLRFTLRRTPPGSVDCSPLAPDLLAGKSGKEIEAIELQCGNRRLRVGELFAVEGDDANAVAFRAGSPRLLRVGAGMKSGSVTVEGECGDYLGLGMLGGAISVAGNAGAFAGSGMRAGRIEIRGDAGDFLGAALAGDRQGMRGGAIVVHGSAGDRAGDRMRRGLVLIKGDVGAYCGSRMLAGTILVAGEAGYAPGFGLKRGTLLLQRLPRGLLPTYRDSGVHSLLFLRLLEKEMRREGGALAGFLPLAGRVRRFCGDLATGGAGEILVRESPE